jgi:hypothetical protein
MHRAWGQYPGEPGIIVIAPLRVNGHVRTRRLKSGF